MNQDSILLHSCWYLPNDLKTSKWATSFAPSRTLTDAHAAAFQTVSADNHPVHYDAVWAARHGHSAPVVHGLQVLAFTAPGATMFPHYIGEVFIAFTELSCKFLKEVHSGDTLYPSRDVVETYQI